MISFVSRFSPDIQQGFYSLQRSVATKNIEQKLINNLELLQSDNFKLPSTNKKSETPAREKPETVRQPAKTNNEVKAPYELAHLGAAGGISKRNAILNTNKNSNSILYAAGDKLKTSTSAVADSPAATLRKADMVRRATLAPAQPSGQDLQVAASATAMSAKAQSELLKQNQNTQNGGQNQLKKDSALPSEDSNRSPDKKINGLTEAEQKIVQELKQTDREVKAHELAHLGAAAGIATSGANFDYEQGPDGIRYAVGGEVNIDTSAVAGDPAATLRKVDMIRRAALAPAQFSGPYLQVAAMAARAQAELLQKNQDTQNGDQNQRGSRLDLSA